LNDEDAYCKFLGFIFTQCFLVRSDETFRSLKSKDEETDG